MLGDFLFSIYSIVSFIMLGYGLNFYYLTWRSTRNLERPVRTALTSFPKVTVQLPIYNERYVARRLIEATCQLDYPRSQLEIQVLDDSTDDTVQICKEVVQEFSGKNDLVYVHRENRTGFKAGALQEGLERAQGEFVAIFDADFIPASDFLLNSLAYFSSKEIGMVQTRWGHLNDDYSTLTRAEGLNLDAHFMIEQRSKSYSELFMSFNGTAGVWRKQCILDAGGWQFTLAEDLDLSFRAQLKGWKFLFLPETLSPAELPVQMNASRRQQYRWAKGAAQCARKFLGEIIRSKLGTNTKIQAIFQLTRHIVFPLSIVQLVLLPFLIVWGYNLSPTAGILSQLTLGPLAYVYALRKIYGKEWPSKLPRYLFMLLFGEGISMTNTVAFFEGLLGRKNIFERTPKFGITSKHESWKEKHYRTPFSWMVGGEISLAAYGVVVLLAALIKGIFLLVPSLVVQVAGFLYVSGLTIAHSIKWR